MVVVGVEFAAAEVMTALYRSQLEALCDLGPSAFQLCWQLLLGTRTQYGQCLHRIVLNLGVLLDVGAKGVHECLYFIRCKVTFCKSGAFSLEVIPFSLSEHMRLNLLAKFHDTFLSFSLSLFLLFILSLGLQC